MGMNGHGEHTASLNLIIRLILTVKPRASSSPLRFPRTCVLLVYCSLRGHCECARGDSIGRQVYRLLFQRNNKEIRVDGAADGLSGIKSVENRLFFSAKIAIENLKK